MNKKKYYSIVFDVKIHNSNAGNFAIPEDICTLFGIVDKMDIDFIVDDMNRNVRLFERSTTSGKEVRIGTGTYRDGQPVRITLFNPTYQSV